MTATGFRLGHRPVFDGLRAISILLVLAFHARVPGLEGGFIGVDVFFVLSGFLITALLVQERETRGGISVKKFYARRALRLFPCLAVVLLFVAIYAMLALPVDGDVAMRGRLFRAITATALYASNWIAAFELGSLHPLAHTWSLAVEEQFYFVWPLIMAWAMRGRYRLGRIAAWTGVAVVASALFRAWLWEGPESLPRVYNGLDTRADSILLGAVVGLLAAANRLPRSVVLVRVAGALGGLALIAIAIVARKEAAWLYLGGETLIALATAAVIMLFLVAPPRGLTAFLESPILVRIGRVSYGLYLWHYVLYWIADYHDLLPDGGVGMAVKLVAVFPVAWLSWTFVEAPCLRLKSRFSA